MKLDELLPRVMPYTGLPMEGLEMLGNLCREKVGGIEGAVVQCGVVNGGSAVYLWQACGGGKRPLWLFDSWEGLPAPDGEKDGGKACAKYTYKITAFGDWCKGDPEKVAEIAKVAGVSKRQLHLVKGWFAETLPAVMALDGIGPIACLHLDADWYDSTIDCLKYLYPHLVTGGLLVLDDYGYWPGVQGAARDYGIDKYLTATPPCGAWMVKP